MLPTPVLRLLNVLSDASLQSEEEYEGWCVLCISHVALSTVLFGVGDERATRGAINSHKNNELLS